MPLLQSASSWAVVFFLAVHSSTVDTSALTFFHVSASASPMQLHVQFEHYRCARIQPSEPASSTRVVPALGSGVGVFSGLQPTSLCTSLVDDVHSLLLRADDDDTLPSSSSSSSKAAAKKRKSAGDDAAVSGGAGVGAAAALRQAFAARLALRYGPRLSHAVAQASDRVDRRGYVCTLRRLCSDSALLCAYREHGPHFPTAATNHRIFLTNLCIRWLTSSSTIACTAVVWTCCRLGALTAALGYAAYAE